MPLEFMGIRGRFIVIAAATFGAAFLGFILFYVLFGTIPALIVAVVTGGSGLLAIYIKQKRTSLQEKASGNIYLQPSLRAIV